MNSPHCLRRHPFKKEDGLFLYLSDPHAAARHH